MKCFCLGVFRKGRNTSGSSLSSANRKKKLYTLVVKIRNTSEAVPLGQYDSLGEYCDPHTTSSMFLLCTAREC